MGGFESACHITATGARLDMLRATQHDRFVRDDYAALCGQRIGTVREVMRTGGTEVLVIKGEREYLIPFAESICTEVDVENKRIVIDPPEGLLELNARSGQGRSG